MIRWSSGRLKGGESATSGTKTLGQRLALLRKQRGYTQVELAEKIGIIQALISDYERDKLRPHAEMVVRFALALDVCTDELLGLTPSKIQPPAAGRRFPRRRSFSTSSPSATRMPFCAPSTPSSAKWPEERAKSEAV